MKYLRELAKEFAQGKISREDYRKQRSVLIQDILSGSVSVPDREFLAPLPPSTDTDITSRDLDYDPLATTEIAVTKPGQKKRNSAAPAPTSSMTASAGQRPFPVWLFVILSLAVLVLIMAVTALFIYTEEEENTLSTATITTEQPPAAGEAANQLIRIFLQQNNWQVGNLRQFESNWQKIGPTEQQAAIDLPIMNQLKNAIYKQILEERAMIALGDEASARAKQQILVDFARSVGIDDPAIAVGP